MKKQIQLYLLLGLLIFNFFVFSALFQAQNSILKVIFLDIGQGDAIFIQTPNGRQMLIDGGINNSVLRELGKIMPFYDRSIDVVLATHPDQDHIGGLPPVLERFNVDLFIRTTNVSTSDAFDTLLKILDKKNIKQEIITNREVLDFGDGVVFDILFPDRDTFGWESNDSSIVGRLIYGENSFLLNGDSPMLIEKYLVEKYGSSLQSDVLKAGHHGSKTSSAEIFVQTVAPTYSIISAGFNNKYGHPTEGVIDTLKKFNSQILETMGKGNIVFESNGQDLFLWQGNYRN